MIKKLHIKNLGTVANAGDYLKFSFRSPYAKMKGVAVFSPEAFASTINKRASVELAVTTDNGDVNILNDLIGIKRKHLDEHKSMLRKLDENVCHNRITGYVKCLENTTGENLTLKLYLMYEE